MKSRPRLSHMFTDANLTRFALELDKNGGNGSRAVATLWPDKERTIKQSSAIASRMRRTQIVRNLALGATARQDIALGKTLDRYAVTADNAANTLARLAFSDYDQVMDWDSITDPDTGERRMVVSIKASADIDPAARTAISEVTQRPDGSISIKLADKRAAIMDLARLKGWVQDKPEQPIAAVQLIIQR